MIAGISTLALPQRQLVQTLRKPAPVIVLGVGLSLLACVYTYIYGRLSLVGYYQQNLTAVGQSLFMAYQTLCSIVVSLFIPMVGVQAFARERERQTLELFLTTPQQAISLVLAKDTAAFCLWTIVLSATAPMLSLMMLFGGVGPDELLRMFIALYSAIFCALAIGLWAGITAKTTIRGMIRAYLLCNLFFGSVNLFFSTWINDPSEIFFSPRSKRAFFLYPSELPGYELVTLVLIGWLFLSLIPRALKREPVPARPRSWKPIRLKGKDSQLWSLLGSREDGDPIDDNEDPMVVCVRQQFLLQVARRAFDIPSILWIGSALLFLGIVLNAPTIIFFYPQCRFIIGLILIAIFTPMVGATTFSGERERDTWDILRTTLLTPLQILNAKIRVTCGQALVYVVAFFVPGLVLYFITWGLLLLVIYGFDLNYIRLISIPELNPKLFFPMSAGHVLAGLVLIGTALLLTTISIWCSVRFRSTLSSLYVSYGLCLVYFFAPVVISHYINALDEPRALYTPPDALPSVQTVIKNISNYHALAIFEQYEKIYGTPNRTSPNVQRNPQWRNNRYPLKIYSFLFWYFIHLFMLVLFSSFFYRSALKRLRNDPQSFPR